MKLRRETPALSRCSAIVGFSFGMVAFPQWREFRETQPVKLSVQRIELMSDRFAPCVCVTSAVAIGNGPEAM